MQEAEKLIWLHVILFIVVLVIIIYDFFKNK